MDFIKSLFNSKKIECPRCLGKGEVDEKDLRRLGRELFWGTGPCAYCNGVGLVPSEMPSVVDPAMSYLTSDLSQAERSLLIRGNAEALARAEDHDIETNQFISEVRYLHFTGEMEAEKIAAFYTMFSDDNSQERYQLLEYIKKIIAHYKRL